ncbi:hypothetical protein [Nocardia mangyaensis]|nr:hypothetical protein [Nocardia mangyaensis]MDO3650518.1 hypothetical protein [Nocardia mangyaensis]
MCAADQVVEVLAEHALDYGYAPFDGQGFLKGGVGIMVRLPESRYSLL